MFQYGCIWKERFTKDKGEKKNEIKNEESGGFRWAAFWSFGKKMKEGKKE